jgi:hypothetical protein
MSTIYLSANSSLDTMNLTYFSYQNDTNGPLALRMTLQGTTNTSSWSNQTVGFYVAIGLGADDMINSSFAVCQFVNQTLNQTFFASNGTN